MDDETRDRWHGDAIAGLSAALRSAPDAAVDYYQGWTLRDLAVHVVRVHVMACTALAEGGTTRPHFELGVDPQASVDALTAELGRVAAQLRADVDGCRHDRVWTPSTPSPPGFWRRRMLSESVLHRWDAESALHRTWAPGQELAAEVIDEFLASRVAPLTSDGQRGVVTLDVGAARWRVAVVGDDHATVSGDPVAMWLWLNRRADVTALQVGGSSGASRRLEELLDALRPARR